MNMAIRKSVPTLRQFMRKSRHFETFNMRIDSQIKKYLETLADMEGLTSAGVVRMMIIEKRNQIKDEMQRLGIYNGELN